MSDKEKYYHERESCPPGNCEETELDTLVNTHFTELENILGSENIVNLKMNLTPLIEDAIDEPQKVGALSEFLQNNHINLDTDFAKAVLNIVRSQSRFMSGGNGEEVALPS